MSNQKQGMFVPALVGGALAGFLSGVPLLNCLCCLWIIGGALLASYLLSKDSVTALTTGDGAIVGIFTGIIAAAVHLFVRIPFHSMNVGLMRNIMEKFAEFAEEMPSGWENLIERGTGEASLFMSLLGLVINAIIFSALGALGGIIGISIFRKKTIQKTQGTTNVPEDTSHRQP